MQVGYRMWMVRSVSSGKPKSDLIHNGSLLGQRSRCTKWRRCLRRCIPVEKDHSHEAFRSPRRSSRQSGWSARALEDPDPCTGGGGLRHFVGIWLRRFGKCGHILAALAHDRLCGRAKDLPATVRRGSKTLRSVTLPSKWYLTWTFDCGAKKGTFLLTSTRQGSKSSVDVNSAKGQTGLGGGGQRPFARAGTYKFAVATICSWKVTASSAPLPAAK